MPQPTAPVGWKLNRDHYFWRYTRKGDPGPDFFNRRSTGGIYGRTVHVMYAYVAEAFDRSSKARPPCSPYR